MDFRLAPFIAIWETTQACDLACVHCRAEAQPLPLPGELSHEEGLALLDGIAEMGTRVCVLSGGDPLKRADLLGLIRYGKAKGLRMATIPAATPRLARGVVRALKDAGLDQMALSLDASTAEAHDRFRGVAGAFEKTMNAVRWAHEAGLPVQINTVLSRHNAGDVDALAGLVSRLGIVFWEVFFLVPVGRGAGIQGLTAEEYEDAFRRLDATAQGVSFIVKITEAPHFRRYQAQRLLEQREERRVLSRVPLAGPSARCGSSRSPGPVPPAAELPPALARRSGPHGTIGQASHAVNAGNGFIFIAYQGEVYPSGFLPLSAGNVRRTPLGTIYRDSPLFQSLRDPGRLKGRCGVCEYRVICGGSRSRAYAVTGDYLAEEPCCTYQPKALQTIPTE